MMTIAICLLAALVVVVLLTTIVIAKMSALSEDRLLKMNAQQSTERLRWAEERKELFEQMKFLNDRYLAKHAQDAVMMDKFPNAPLGNDQDRPRTLIPEGL